MTNETQTQRFPNYGVQESVIIVKSKKPKHKTKSVYTPQNAIKWNSNGGADNTARPWIVQRVADLAERYTSSDFNLLDIGSGTGRWTKQFAKYATDVYGLDISPEMINIARETNSAENIEYRLENILKTELSGFSAVTALASLQQAKTRKELNSIYEKVGKILLPEGHLLFYAPHPIAVFMGKSKMFDCEFHKTFSYEDNFPFTSSILMEDGTRRTGSGYHHPMIEYTADLTRHGFKIVTMKELFAKGERFPNALVVDAQLISSEGTK